jgi:hypothetical protein
MRVWETEKDMSHNDSFMSHEASLFAFLSIQMREKSILKPRMRRQLPKYLTNKPTLFIESSNISFLIIDFAFSHELLQVLNFSDHLMPLTLSVYLSGNNIECVCLITSHDDVCLDCL